jgi:hypothetical protein
MFGAPLGGTTVGGHHGLESVAVSLITPPNFGSGGGSCFPSMVVVALGEPSVPVVWTSARAEGATAMTAAASIAPRMICFTDFIVLIWFVVADQTAMLPYLLRCVYRTLGQCDAVFRRAQGEAKNGQQVATVS